MSERGAISPERDEIVGERRAARLIVKRSRSRFQYPHDLISE